MSSIFSANRVAAIAAFLTGIASGLAGIESALPTAAANTVATAVGVIGSIATCLHFMYGSQKDDANKVKIATAIAQPASTVTGGSGTSWSVAPVPPSVTPDQVLTALQAEDPDEETHEVTPVEVPADAAGTPS